MKKDKNIVNIEEWIEIARKDWKRMKRSLRAVDAEAAGFFLQQSLEKYLKAFILKHGWNLRKIHELDTLLDDAAKFDAYGASLRPLEGLCRTKIFNQYK